MLVGLGFNPLYAAGICLIANTVPVAFGSVGIPVITAAQIGGLPEMAVSQMVGRTLPILALIIPFYLVVLMSGFKRSLEVLPAILVSGIVLSLVQFLAANFINPMLPGILSGLASIICLTVFLKYWKPKSIWRFKEEPQQTIDTELKYSTWQILRAWSPFIIMTLLIVAWGMQPVLAAIISMPLIGMGFKSGVKVLFSTINQLKYPIITIASIVGFAYIANNSGMSITMALALAGTGILFPFFSPILGWLGVFLTGSDTSSNAMFCKLQYTTADTLGIDPLLTVSANASGGVVGKLISPQSIAIGAAAVGIVGRESELFRFTLKHSFILLFIICIITVLQAYVFQWIIPTYKLADVNLTQQTSDLSEGFLYLLILAVVVITFMLSVFLRNRKMSVPYAAAVVKE